CRLTRTTSAAYRRKSAARDSQHRTRFVLAIGINSRVSRRSN
ncbi:hypothetical protein D018_2151B, partial [Vibrio parahaemolyticus VP2007-007]